MHLDRRLVSWGVLFIVAGGVALAVHEGSVNPSLAARWPELWPLVIVAVGIWMLLSRSPGEWLGSLAVAIVVGVMAGGLLGTGIGDLSNVTGCGGGASRSFATQTGSLDPAGRIDVEFDCGELAIGTLPGSTWQLSGSDASGRAPAVNATASSLSVRSTGSNGGFLERGHVIWTLDLPTASTLDLGVTLNAGEGNLQLGGAHLASVGATVNAGRLSVALGSEAVSEAVNVTVNAGTAAVTSGATSGTFDLSLNAGSLDVCVPRGAPVRVRWTGTLASNDLDGLGLDKLDDHTWASSGLDAAAPHLELDVSANAGSFTLKLGGACGA